MFHEVDELIKSGKYQTAEKLLLTILQKEEEKALYDGGVAPGPYEKLISLYWKTREIDKRNRTIVRFLIQPKYRGARPRKIYEKYLKAFKEYSESELQEMIYTGYLSNIQKSPVLKVKLTCSSCGKIGLYLRPTGIEIIGYCCAYCCESNVGVFDEIQVSNDSLSSYDDNVVYRDSTNKNDQEKKLGSNLGGVSYISEKDIFKLINSEITKLDTYYDSLGLHAIEKTLKSTIKGDKRTIIQEVHDGSSPEMMVHIIINNITADFLESGRFHIYRGALNIAGEGLLKVFIKSYDKLHELDPITYTKELIKDQNEVVKRNIKVVG